MQTVPEIKGSSRITGSLPEYRADPLAFLYSARQLGDMVHYRLGPYSTYLVSTPELVQQVLVTRDSQFYKSRPAKRFFSALLGNGLLLSDGDEHKRQRKLVQPAFHHSRLEGYGKVMIDRAYRTVETWCNDQVFDISEQMMSLTLDTAVMTLFGTDIQDREQVGKAVTTAQEITGRRATKMSLPYWVPTRENQRLHEAVNYLDQVVDRLVEERRRENADRGDLLSMLLMSVDEDDGRGMATQQLRDEVRTLFVAGHETTANALVWTWYLLSQYPDIQAKMCDEVRGVLGGRAITLQDIPSLPYTTAVLKESMRLYPPAWRFTRDAIADVEIGGVMIRKGHTVCVSPFAMHRDERWFANPEQFDPERFMGDREKQIPRYAYLPFGAGGRVCVGQHFAMMEASIILAAVAQKCQLYMMPGSKVVPEPLITLRVKDGGPQVKVVMH